ncbi:hypothetical protein NW755_000987 [Fusarium falciforme]|uniref:Uncharacterized protein n=1 Tax=Fusarium falciforme TaxID=195108 RepID=A0A9W8RL10_9HYPO|nr:hypothetical protein NW755_000987 [Fusarium falciforme]
MASGQSSPVPAPTPTPARTKNFWKPCAILLDGWDGPILGGKALGVQSEVNSYLFMYNLKHSDPSIGFSLEFPYGRTNEDEGFGACHKVDLNRNTTAPSEMLKIEIKFPREGFSRSVEAGSDELRSRLTTTQKHLSVVEVRLRDPTLTKIHGFGMPFKNFGHPFDELLNQRGVIASEYTLLDFLRQDKFQIVVAATSSAVETTWHVNKLPPSFAYPYGNIHNWDTGRYAKMLDENKGPQFAPSWSYHDDNAHLTVMTQSEAQDFMWLNRAAGLLALEKVSAYFVERNQGNTSRYYAIITLSKMLQFRHKHALCRLAKAGSFKLGLYDNCADKVNSGEWDAKIVDHSQDIDVLNAHPITELDMILDVRRPLPTKAARGSDFAVITFSDRSIADVALKEGVHK